MGLVATLLLFVFAFAFLALEHLAEDGLGHDLVHLLLEAEGLVGRDLRANLALGGGCLDHEAKFLGGVLAVRFTIFGALFRLRCLVLPALLEEALDLDANCAPSTCPTIYLLQLLKELLVLNRFAHNYILFYYYNQIKLYLK